MPGPDASELARRLGRQAEAVCRRYLPAGRREGQYWQVGDVRNTPGRSMFVRLADSARGPAGKWTDAATGEHGDLLDVIRASLGAASFAAVVAEARGFLSLPPPDPAPHPRTRQPAPPRSPEAARRLIHRAQPLVGTLAETYLRSRGLTALHGPLPLRFHPRCCHRSGPRGLRGAGPALIAAVTDLAGRITGAHRTWLSPDGTAKAAIATPRKAMGGLLGHAVRFGGDGPVMAAGEGIETVLSVREVLPGLPLLAALSAPHLAACAFPATLRRLYVLCDADAAGAWATHALTARARAASIVAIPLCPVLGDFNDDLRLHGRCALRAGLSAQLASEDLGRFLV